MQWVRNGLCLPSLMPFYPFPRNFFREAVKSGFTLAAALCTITNTFLVRVKYQRRQSQYNLQVALPVAGGINRATDPSSGYLIASPLPSVYERFALALNGLNDTIS